MPLHHVEQVMGTVVSIDILDSDDGSLVHDLVQWFHHVDQVFSPYKENSPISRIGRGELSIDDPELPDATANEIIDVLERCTSLHLETDGVFDVWSLPSPNGTRFDPCGYVKGWSVECAAGLVEQRSAGRYLINAGGDMAMNGLGPDDQPWRVGVRRAEDANVLALVVHNAGTRLGIATSGSYERGAHIRDPRLDQPVTELASTTVVGPSLAEADAFATVLYVMGVDGLAWLARHHPDYSGCVMTWEREVLMSPGFDRHLAV
jgi:thiamine biosynthesis lipoprotein